MFFPKYALAGLLAALTLPAQAQSNSLHPSQSNPSAQVAVPPLQYSSPLRQYQAYAPQSPADWREANDTVARIGGWQAYAAEVWEASQKTDGSGAESSDAPAAPAHQHH